MPRPEKISIGVLFGRPNFAVSEAIGEISEAVIERMDGKTLDEKFFTEFSVQPGISADFRSADKTRILHLDTQNLIFTRDHYNQAHTADWKKISAEFNSLWGIIKQTVKLHEIVRIGIVSEYRIATENNDQSNILLSKLTKLASTGHKKKFILTYETYYPVSTNVEFSPENCEFINVIESFYDSTQDAHHGQDGYMNITLDVQHYYNPTIPSAKCTDEISKLNGIFLNHEKTLKEKIITLGLING